MITFTDKRAIEQFRAHVRYEMLQILSNVEELNEAFKRRRLFCRGPVQSNNDQDYEKLAVVSASYFDEEGQINPEKAWFDQSNVHDTVKILFPNVPDVVAIILDATIAYVQEKMVVQIKEALNPIDDEEKEFLLALCSNIKQIALAACIPNGNVEPSLQEMINYFDSLELKPIDPKEYLVHTAILRKIDFNKIYLQQAQTDYLEILLAQLNEAPFAIIQRIIDSGFLQHQNIKLETKPDGSPIDIQFFNSLFDDQGNLSASTKAEGYTVDPTALNLSAVYGLSALSIRDQLIMSSILAGAEQELYESNSFKMITSDYSYRGDPFYSAFQTMPQFVAISLTQNNGSWFSEQLCPSEDLINQIDRLSPKNAAYFRALTQLEQLNLDPQYQEINNLKNDIIVHIKGLKDKGEERVTDLTTTLDKTIDLLQGRMSPQDYALHANVVEGRQRLGMKALGGLLILLGVLVASAGVTLAATGFGLPIGGGVIGAGLVVSTVGLLFFNKGRQQTGLSEKVSDLASGASNQL